MKLRFSLLAILVAAIVPALADLTLTQEVQQGTQRMTITTKVKGQKIRVEAHPKVSAIIDTATGETTTLMHDQKAAMTIPANTLNDLKKQLMASGGNDSTGEAPSFKATGAKKTVNGFACEEYVAESKQGKISAWVTQDIPDGDKLFSELTSSAGDANPYKDLTNFSGLNGFPVQTTIQSPDSGDTVLTVVDLKRDTLPDSEFTIPSDYKKMAMPAIPGLVPGN